MVLCKIRNKNFLNHNNIYFVQNRKILQEELQNIENRDAETII